MRIEELPGAKAEQIRGLRAAGITTCRQLVRAGRTQQGLLQLARSSELPQGVLEDVMQRAQLSQIRGIGRATLAALLEIGIDSPRALAEQTPSTLRVQFQKILNPPPNLAVIEDWIRQARREKGSRSGEPTLRR